jgi:hypothetical protein
MNEQTGHRSWLLRRVQPAWSWRSGSSVSERRSQTSQTRSSKRVMGVAFDARGPESSQACRSDVKT